MKKTLLSIVTISIITNSLVLCQIAPIEKGLQAITLNTLQSQLGFLASDWTEGRMAGERGEYKAAD